MLRLDPGEGRVRTARAVSASGRAAASTTSRAACARCFGLRTAIVTAFVDNDIGRLLEDLMLQGGVDTSLVQLGAHDGIGRNVRNGLNFTERGFGVRGALGVLRPRPLRRVAARARRGRLGPHLRRERRALVPHRRHLRRALRDHRRTWSTRRCTAAHATAPSSPTTSTTGPACGRATAARKRAREVNRRLAQYVDVMIGNEEDFTACLGLEVEGADEQPQRHRHRRISVDDRAGRRRSSQTSRSSRRRCAPSRPRPSTTGARSRGRATADSSRRRRARTSKSSTASAAATASPPA